MAKSEYVLSIGDDNVVLTRFNDKKFVNAWLASPDPATALEELGEALAEDKKARVSVLIDTLDQAFKEEEVPKVGVLDRRKILSRHITMAFPGQSMRGARLIGVGSKNTTLLYEFASVPLDGRIPGWIDFYESLPNEKGGIFAIAPENADIIGALAPKGDAADLAEKEAETSTPTHWRHFIGINVTGGLRQIISKNGRLSLTRLTQAPPADTPPDEFADMIVRDFKATITYLRRLGYQVGDPLDLIVLTTDTNRAALERLEWTGARGATFLTPHEAAMMLGLGAIGPEEQAYGDVLQAAWFVNKRKPNLPLTRSVAMGDMRDDLRELGFLVAPYAAGVVAAAVLIWTGLTISEHLPASERRAALEAELAQTKNQLAEKRASLGGQTYEASLLRNVFDVEDSMDRGKTDFVALLSPLYDSLENDAVIMSMNFASSAGSQQVGGAPNAQSLAPDAYSLSLRLKLNELITTAEEAVAASTRVEKRLADNLGKDFTVKMTKEPVANQAAQALAGGLGSSTELEASSSGVRDEPFFMEVQILHKGTTK